MEAANERKTAGVGDDQIGVVLADSDFQDRAIFSGFDIGYEELLATSEAIAGVYAQAAYLFGLRALFISAWCDGLLTGLLLASLPPTPEAGVTDDTGPEGSRNGTD